MGAIHDFLAADHDRLEGLIRKAASYEAFRRGLLKHIGMEEKILLPAVKRLTGKPAALAGRARLDHGALTALLVPSPTQSIFAAIRSILSAHNELEERDGGLYLECEQALGPESASLLKALQDAPDIPPSPHYDGPRVMAVVRRALAAAGYAAYLKEK